MNLINKIRTKALNIVTDATTNRIIVKDNPYQQPFSWFITNENGNFFQSGHISNQEQIITLNNLKSGHYYFRVQGEVYEFNIAS